MNDNRTFFIGNTPAVVYGNDSENVFLFVHGQCGNKEEAKRFSDIAQLYGWQTLSIDLPEHNGRKDGVKLLPWNVVPELTAVMDYMQSKWRHIALRANSIGAWFCLQAFGAYNVEKCMFLSPLLDMENMISNLMRLSGVTEQRLEIEREIPTEFGQTLSMDYLDWVRKHPVGTICRDTYILYATGDELIPESVYCSFAEKNNCELTVMNGGEHWFHTDQQLEFLKNWEERILKD